MEDLRGRTLKGQYRIDAFVGRGGMAEVYRALDLRRSYPVAIKVMQADLAEDIEFVERFRREAHSLSQLAHENIVRFYEFAREGRLAFLVMDYVEGMTLRQRILEAEGPLPLAEALDILRQVCAALHYAHEEGVIHRDVKPGNIMLEIDPRTRTRVRALVGDFGIAKAADTATLTAAMPGTPAYMSPEQCRSEALDRRTDVYSLGIVAFEMLAGRRPFRGETEGRGQASTREQIRWEQMHALPPSLRAANPEVPPPMEQAVLRALAKNPADRPQTVIAFYRELAGAGGRAPAASARPVKEAPRVRAPQPAPPASSEDSEAGRLYGRAAEAMTQEDWSRAIQDLNALLAINPGYRDTIARLTEANRRKRFADLLAQAQAAYRAEDWTEAIGLSAEAIAADPEHTDARELLRRARTAQQAGRLYAQAQAARQSDDWTGARGALEQLVALAPGYRDAQALLAEAQAAQEGRRRIAALQAEAQRALEEGRWAAAIQQGEALLALDLDRPEIRRLLDEARRELEVDRRAHALFEQGQACAGREEWAAAAEAAEAALALRPGTPAFRQLAEKARSELALAERYAAAQAALAAQDWAAAVHALQEIAEPAPGYRDSRALLGEARVQKARAANLADQYARAAQAMQAGLWAEAAQAWERLLGEAPDYRDAPAHLAEAQERQAQQGAARALEARVRDLAAQATAHERAGEWAPAVDLLQQALALAPGRPRLTRQMADARAELEAQERAAGLYRQAEEACAQEAWPEARAAAEELARLQPGEERTRTLLARCREGSALAEAYDHARAEFEAGHWAASARMLQGLLARAPEYKEAAALLRQTREALAAGAAPLTEPAAEPAKPIAAPALAEAPLAGTKLPPEVAPPAAAGPAAVAEATTAEQRERRRIPIWGWALAGLLALALAAVPIYRFLAGGEPSLTPTAPAPAIAILESTFTPMATARSAATSTGTPTATASPAPTDTDTPAATVTPTDTPPPTESPTPPSTDTPPPRPSATPRPQPTRTRPAPTRTPAAGPQFPAPVLVGPADGQGFSSQDAVVLEWQPVGQLPANAYYVVRLGYSHGGQTWYDETPWIKATGWTVSEHQYLLDLTDDGRFHWSVQVMLKTGEDAQGKPKGTPLSPPGAERTLTWKRSGGGGPGGGGGVPTLAPP